MEMPRDELTRLSEVIGLIYEGATDPSRWTQDILPAVTSYIETPACILFSTLHTPQNGGYSFVHGITQDLLDLYMNKYHEDDVWTIAALEKNLFFEGSVFCGEDLVPREQFRESKLYKECLSLNKNIAQPITSVIFGVDSTTSMPAACTLLRGFHHPTYGEEERARMHLLQPHLSRSLGVMQRLRTAELAVATTLAALDRLPSGTVLLDGAGRVVFANHAAQRMLDKGDGLYLRKSAHADGLGELEAHDVVTSRAINAAILATLKRDPYATPHFSKSVVVSQPSGLGNYTLQFSALGNQNEFGGGQGGYAAIVFIADSAQKPVIDPASLQGAYGLTTAEARAAIALLEHVSAKEAAQVLNVSPHTVRTQIRSIYAKLGVDTRARFVKVMLGLAGQGA